MTSQPLSDGHVVYAGQANSMIDYFTGIGYPCPPLTNPCDFYIDLTTIDHRLVNKNLYSAGTQVLMELQFRKFVVKNKN